MPHDDCRRRNRSEVSWLTPISFGDYADRLHVGRAMAMLDCNRDQQPDLLITHMTEPVALLVNHTNGPFHWVRLSLVGRQSSRDAVGAVIHVHAGDDHWIVPVVSGDGYYASSSRTLHIGLGDATVIEKLVVEWPRGETQEFRNLAADQSYLIVEDQPLPFPLDD